jgi:deazaflavin-dependent oxidoreductase (nitroreductase family)
MTTANAAVQAGRPRLSRPIRWLAKALSPLASPLAGTRWFPLWGVLEHTGRRSGTVYATPVVALRTDTGFLIPLPFGNATQWAKNLFAAGGGALRHAGHRYAIEAPEVVDGDTAIGLPGPVRRLSGVLGLRHFVRVRAVVD